MEKDAKEHEWYTDTKEVGRTATRRTMTQEREDEPRSPLERRTEQNYTFVKGGRRS